MATTSSVGTSSKKLEELSRIEQIRVLTSIALQSKAPCKFNYIADSISREIKISVDGDKGYLKSTDLLPEEVKLIRKICAKYFSEDNFPNHLFYSVDSTHILAYLHPFVVQPISNHERMAHSFILEEWLKNNFPEMSESEIQGLI